MRISITAALAAATLLLAAGAAATPVPGITELQSVSTAGVQGDQDSEQPAISADGRFVAFSSFATNLVERDTNGFADVFLRDRLLGTTERISVGPNGREADGDSGILNLMQGPSISADGRFIAYDSMATNLVNGDSNNNADVFVYDRVGGTTTRVSVATGGAEANAGGYENEISADGRYVAFTSTADNIVPPDDNFRDDIFVHDRQTGTTELITNAFDGADSNSSSFSADLSGDGRFVYFTSFANNLIAGDEDDIAVDAYLFDRASRAMEGITTRPSTGPVQHSSAGAISANGRLLTFTTAETNFLPSDANGSWEDVFLVDRQTGELELISVNDEEVQADRGSFAGPVTDDGRYVVFISGATNLGGGTTNFFEQDVFRRDRVAGLTEIVSVGSDGTESTFASTNPAIAANAHVIAFQSRASEWVPEAQDVFANDIWVRDARPAADLAVTKVDSPDPVAARGQVTYTVTIANNGPGGATGVTLTDVLPASSSFVSATPSTGTCARAGKSKRDSTVTCDLRALASGATATVTIVVEAGRETMTNTATVRANEPDPNRADNTATETTTVVR